MDKKGWLILAATSLALATATLLVLLRYSPWGRQIEDVPELITDCYDRIRDIEMDLQQLRPSAQPAG